MKDVPYWETISICCHCPKQIRSGFVHSCCTIASRVMVKMYRDFYHEIKRLGIRRISLHSGLKMEKFQSVSALHILAIYLFPKKIMHYYNKRCFPCSWLQEELKVLFIKSWLHPSWTICPPRLRMVSERPVRITSMLISVPTSWTQNWSCHCPVSWCHFLKRPIRRRGLS